MKACGLLSKDFQIHYMTKIDGTGPFIIVDDDLDALRLAEMVYPLTGIPNRLLVLPSGQALIQYLDHVEMNKAERPSMVLMDVNMPELSGHETLHLIRIKKDFSQKPPVIIFTSSSDEADRKRALQNGADAYQLKPSDVDDLLNS